MSHQVGLRRWVPIAAVVCGALAVLTVMLVARAWSVSAQSALLISKSASAMVVHPNDEVTYTIVFTNVGVASTSAVMTDVIPFGVSYVPGSATAGAVYVPGPPARVSWSGTLDPGLPVVVTFRVRVVEPETLGPYPILNEARIGNTWSNPVTIYSTRHLMYLPLVTRNYAPAPVWPWGRD